MGVRWRRAKRALWRSTARHHGKPVARTIARAAEAYLGAYENARAHSLMVDGEAVLLTRLATGEVHTAFDVGANVGKWSLLAARTFPGVQIHAFEVVPSTAEILAERTGDKPGITANSFGLADREAEVQVRVGGPRNRSSFVADIAGQTEMETGRVRRGDEYAREREISHIDFLKVDCEGADHLVLEGFSSMLTAGAIDVIQFEYGHFALQTRFLLADFYALLEGHGYRVGKLFPDGVAFRDYSARHEDFQGLNYVAVLASRPDLVRLLSLGNGTR